MAPIDMFGWLLCVLLTISFIASIIFLPKNIDSEEESDEVFSKSIPIKKEIKKEH
ncbi:hypothetical protein M3221_20660 [Domibacillus indicus]|uniref:hypothetical protein n=1 Tax=Domibacillus TaxID=1433999 RepID=UPI00203EB81C|nr:MULTISPECIES: hypothetical protein [Domibacillus]MCM3790760.1 hypothetical protein [Domibacillus indicus]WNS79459.1 hypothetical protein RRU94_18185 [Domibacillus sp. DTU_2020_1001157_1_SI_ALB_TIR_016]